MKKLYATTCLLLAVLLAMTGCGGSGPVPAPTNPPAAAADPTMPPTPTAAPPAVTEAPATEPPAPAEPINWVIPDHLKVGYEDTFSWTCAEGIDWNVRISLPALTCGETFADEFNAEMKEYFERMSSYFQDHMDRKDDPHVVSVTFEACRNNQLLSVVIIEESVDGHKTYVAYNYDLVAHRELSIAEICDRYLDIDYPQFLSATDQLVMADFDEIFSHLLAKEPEFYEFVRQLVFSDITAVSERDLYLAEDGTVMLIYRAPTESGSLEDHTVLPFSHHKFDIPSEADAYHWLLNIATTLDDTHREGYIQILREAFEDDPEDLGEVLARMSQEHIDAIVRLLAEAYQDNPDRLRYLTRDEIDSPSIRDAILDALKG